MIKAKQDSSTSKQPTEMSVPTTVDVSTPSIPNWADLHPQRKSTQPPEDASVTTLYHPLNDAAARLNNMTLYDPTTPANQKSLADMPLEMVHAILGHIPIIDALVLHGGPLHRGLTTHPQYKKLLTDEVVVDLQWLYDHRVLFREDPVRMELHLKLRKLHVTPDPVKIHDSLFRVIHGECTALTTFRPHPNRMLSPREVLAVHRILLDPRAPARVHRIIELQRSALNDFPGMLKLHSDPTDEPRRLPHLLGQLDACERKRKRYMAKRPDMAYLQIAAQPHHVPYPRYIKLLKYLDSRISTDSEVTPVADLVRNVIDTHIPLFESDKRFNIDRMDFLEDVKRRCEAVIAICQAVLELQARQDKHGQYARQRGKQWLQVRIA